MIESDHSLCIFLKSRLTREPADYREKVVSSGNVFVKPITQQPSELMLKFEDVTPSQHQDNRLFCFFHLL